MRESRKTCCVFGVCLLLACSKESTSSGTGTDRGETEANGGSHADDYANPDSDAVTCVPAPTGGFHVAVDGNATGDGSLSFPWDLSTGLGHPAALMAGDTLWIHGGVYAGAFTSTLHGTEAAPIVVRPWPGDRVVIDGAPSAQETLTLEGAWAEYHGLEITNTHGNRTGERAGGVDVFGEHLKLVNSIIHDTGGNGFWSSAAGLSLYGCLIYNNGYNDDDRAHGHGVYTQNLDGTKTIEDNIIFNNYSFGIHVYTENGAIEGYDIIGNIWFQSGSAALGTGTLKDNCMVGGVQPADRILLRDNLGWAAGPGERNVQFGYGSPDNGSISLVDNYPAGTTLFSQPWETITMAGNTFAGNVEGFDLADFPNNTHITVQPTENRVFVRPNRHEDGRAHIAVFNWTAVATQEVDLGQLLDIGDRYEIRNAQAPLLGVVASGVYDGLPVSLPMAGLLPAQPLGSPDSIEASETSGVYFNAFVLRSPTKVCD